MTCCCHLLYFFANAANSRIFCCQPNTYMRVSRTKCYLLRLLITYCSERGFYIMHPRVVVIRFLSVHLNYKTLTRDKQSACWKWRAPARQGKTFPAPSLVVSNKTQFCLHHIQLNLWSTTHGTFEERLMLCCLP